MFSPRTQWQQRPNALTAAWGARLSAGLPGVDLTESNPTRCGFDYPEERILAALADPRGLVYQPSPFGLREAREAVARQAEGDVSGAGNGMADPDRIVLTASTSEAYSWLFKLLCAPDDRVLVPRPSYPLFDYLAALEDVGLDAYPLTYERGWRLDLEALERAWTPRTRAVILVHPNNPTGHYVKTLEWDALAAWCAARDLAVISDEVFLPYPFTGADPVGGADRGGAATGGADDPERAPSLAPGAPCLTFSLGGLSKSAGLPQVKLGWIQVGGPDERVQEALSRLEIIADTYLSVNTPAQWALPSLLHLRHQILPQIRARTRANLDWLRDRRDARSSWELLRAEGGWYGILRVPRSLSEEEWCLRLARDEGVLLHPGYFFDFEQEAYLIASLLPAEDRFQDAVGRVLALIARFD